MPSARMQNPAEGTSAVAIKHSPVFLLPSSRWHGLRLWGVARPPRGAPTLLAGAEGEAAHKQLATFRSVRFRPQGRRRQRISVAVNGSHLDLVHSGSHQTHTFAV